MIFAIFLDIYLAYVRNPEFLTSYYRQLNPAAGADNLPGQHGEGRLKIA